MYYCISQWFNEHFCVSANIFCIYQVYFRIIGGDEDAQFSFRSIPNEDGPRSGEILIAKPLDFETRNSYLLTIEAYNKEAKTNANALTVMYISLLLSGDCYNYF